MPDWRSDLRRRLSGLHLSPTREAEIVDELSQHLDDHYRELLAGGVAPDEAERLALAEFRAGNVLARHIAALRLAHQPPPTPAPGAPAGRPLAAVWQDVRHAGRVLRKQPAFALVAILTLALGIGANSAIFALVDATLLRPLPYPEPERLVMMWERTAASPRENVAPSNLDDWNTRSTSFEAMGGFVPNVASMVLRSADGTTETVPRQWVTAGIFQALGVTPVAGRTFLPSDDGDRTPVVILSESFWRTRFNADPRIVGSRLQLDGEPWLVVGVVPDEAQVIGRSSMWGLRPIRNLPPAARRQHFIQAIGRLKPGVTLEAASAEMSAVSEQLAREYPGTNTGRSVMLEPLRDVVIGGDLRQTAGLFLGVVGFVLLICCANVANLLLTRTSARRRELALRVALGASRGRLIGLVLTESLMLAVIGGAVGLALAGVILEVAPAIVPQGLLPATVALTLDGRVIAFCALTALLVGLVFGILPARHATALSSTHANASGTRTTAGGGLARGVLVAAQVATAVMLLVGAGLLLRSLLAVDNVDRGYRADRVLTMMVDPPGLPSLLGFYENVERDLRAMPAVRDVAWATTLPMGTSYNGEFYFTVQGDPPPAPGAAPMADYQIVSSTYFSAVDLSIVAGRAFDGRDVPDGNPVCIVNEAFVRRHLQGRAPIGMRLAIRSSLAEGAPVAVREIVGVARQVKGRPDETEDLIQIYVPIAQNTPGDIFLLVRARSGEADDLAPDVRAVIARLDPNGLVSVRDVATLDEIARQATSRHRFRAALVASFAGLALALAMVGVFGVLAYSVQQRVREIGVRRALGASTRDVVGLVAGSAARVIGAGAAVGLVLSILLGRLLSAMLFNVEPIDPVTFAAVASMVGIAALLSIAAPLWRATRVDPAIALRAD